MKIIIFLEYFILRDTQVIDSLVPLEINIMIILLLLNTVILKMLTFMAIVLLIMTVLFFEIFILCNHNLQLYIC